MSDLEVLEYGVTVAVLTFGLGYLVLDAIERWIEPALAARRARRAERERRAEAIRRAEEVRWAKSVRRVPATCCPVAVVADHGPATPARELCSLCTERPALLWLHLVPESQDPRARVKVCLACHRGVRRSWAIASDVRRALALDAVAGEVDARDVQPGGAR